MPKKGERRRVQTGKLVHEEEHAEGTHDFTPWVKVNSSRMGRARYDHATGAIQIDWDNGNPDYVYRDAGYETWRAFIRAGSKGKFVNNRLNSLDYRRLDADELDIPSNEDFSAQAWSGGATPGRANPMSRGKRLAE